MLLAPTDHPTTGVDRDAHHLQSDEPAGPLTAPGGILLLSCYELGHQPLALAGPAAHLRRAGFRPEAIDTAVEELPEEAIRRARLVAIAVPMHTALRLGARVAERVRAVNPAAHICFFGLYALLNADYLLRKRSIGDSAIGGEVAEPLEQLGRALDRGASYDGLPGVATRDSSAAPIVKAAVAVQPDRHGLPPLRSYAGLERDGTIVPAGYVEATRGCHHTCRHCPITPVYGGRLVVVPRDLVLADARSQIGAGARHITFGDPDFFNGPTHGMRIARALHDEFPWLSFDATIKIEHLIEHQRLLPELANLGCAFVVSAVESLSEAVLAKLKKGHDRAQIETALALLDAVDLPMRPSLLPFTPWEGLDGYLDLLRFVAERDLLGHVDPIQFAIRLLVPPGSALLDDPIAGDWLGELDAAAFTYRWFHPDPRMDDLHQAVSAIVERAAARNEPARRTFRRIWDAAHNAAGAAPPPVPIPVVNRRPPPRLTESWFC